MKRIAGVIAATAGIEPASFRTFIPMLFLLSYVASVIIIWKGCGSVRYDGGNRVRSLKQPTGCARLYRPLRASRVAISISQAAFP